MNDKNNMLALSQERFSARKFTPEAVSQEDLDYIMECVRLAPSAVNRQPWRWLIVRSEEAKALGYKMGDPFYQVKEKLEAEGVAIFSSNYTLYGSLSNRVMSMLSHYSPRIDQYSIDESFFEADEQWRKFSFESMRKTILLCSIK